MWRFEPKGLMSPGLGDADPLPNGNPGDVWPTTGRSSDRRSGPTGRRGLHASKRDRDAGASPLRSESAGTALHGSASTILAGEKRGRSGSPSRVLRAECRGGMMDGTANRLNDFIDLFRCPKCGGDLGASERVLQCTECRESFTISVTAVFVSLRSLGQKSMGMPPEIAKLSRHSVQ